MGQSEGQPSSGVPGGTPKSRPPSQGRVSESSVSLSLEELRHLPSNQVLQPEGGGWKEGSRTGPEGGGGA